MKKRIGMLALVLCLMLPQMTVCAVEKDSAQGINKYVNLMMAKAKGSGSSESMSSLKNSLEEVIQNLDPKDAQKILDFVNEKIEDDSWKTKSGIDQAIEEAQQEFDVTLTKEQKELIHSVAQKVKNLGIDPSFLVEQAEEIYEKYSEELKEEMTQAGEKVAEEVQEKVKEEVSRSLNSYFNDMIRNVKSFFRGIFKR